MANHPTTSTNADPGSEAPRSPPGLHRRGLLGGTGLAIGGATLALPGASPVAPAAAQPIVTEPAVRAALAEPAARPVDGALHRRAVEVREACSRNMAEMWTTFARTGRPAAVGQPEWPAYDLVRRPMMRIDAVCSVIDDRYAAEREMWKALGYIGG